MEDIGMVWEALIQLQGYRCIDDISNECGFDGAFIRKALFSLTGCGLVVRQKETEVFRYAAITELSSLSWAQAVGAGVDLEILELHAVLTRAGREEAVSMATNGFLDQLGEEERNKRREAREKLLTGRAASEAAATDLAKMVLDVNAAVSLVAESEDLRNSSVYSILIEAHEQSSKALSILTQTLKKK